VPSLIYYLKNLDEALKYSNDIIRIELYPNLKGFMMDNNFDFTLNTLYEVPYLAGYSQDGRTIYIDKRLPRWFTMSNGSKIDMYTHLMVHEVTEKYLEDTKNYKYQYAHERATTEERKSVEEARFDWDEYQKYCLKMVKELETFHEVPPDLDLKPELDSKDYYRYYRIKKMKRNEKEKEKEKV